MNSLALTANSNDSHTKSQVDCTVALKAPLASPAFTGTLSTTGDITFSNATATNTAANKSLTLQQTGDIAGGTIVLVRNRECVRGISVQTTNAELILRCKYQHHQ